AAAHAPLGQKNEPVAHALGVAELMDGKKERASVGGFASQHPHHVAGLPQVEAVERLGHQNDPMRRQESERPPKAPGVALPKPFDSAWMRLPSTGCRPADATTSATTCVDLP